MSSYSSPLNEQNHKYCTLLRHRPAHKSHTHWPWSAAPCRTPLPCTGSPPGPSWRRRLDSRMPPSPGNSHRSAGVALPLTPMSWRVAFGPGWRRVEKKSDGHKHTQRGGKRRGKTYTQTHISFDQEASEAVEDLFHSVPRVLYWFSLQQMALPLYMKPLLHLKVPQMLNNTYLKAVYLY